MLYDRRDFGLLRLAGTYQWLPAAPLKKLSALKTLRREAELLSTLGLVSYARSGEYLMPSPQGYEFLSGIDQTCQPPTKRPYAQSPALRRRLEVGTILLTCIGAGIEPAFGKVEHLKRQPVFFPAFALRNAGGNLMNAAGCAGFGHWGSTAYMTLYVSAQNTGFVMTNELGHLHNLASVFSETLDTPQALILAGESYQSVYEVLTKKTLSKRHGKKGFVDYSEAYQKLSIPACLVSCDNTGVMQLAVMRQTDYRARLPSAHAGTARTMGYRRQTAMWTEIRWSLRWTWICAAWIGCVPPPSARAGKRSWWPPWRVRCPACCSPSCPKTRRSDPYASTPRSSPWPLAGTVRPEIPGRTPL